jgi:hypothetical protein
MRGNTLRVSGNGRFRDASAAERPSDMCPPHSSSFPSAKESLEKRVEKDESTYLWSHCLVDGAPPNVFLRTRLLDNAFV